MRKQRGKSFLAVLLLICLFCIPLTACGETGILLKRRLLLQGIGVDWKGNSYQITVQATQVEEGAGESTEVLTAQGRSVRDAFNNLTLKSGKEPLFSHHMLLLFGETCARRGLNHVLDFFVRASGLNAQISVAQAKGEANALLTLQEQGQTLSAQSMVNLIESGNANGKIPTVTLLDFSNQLAGQGSPYLPLIGESDGKWEALGMACFHKSFLVGSLLGEDARGALTLMEKVTRSAYAVSVEGIGTVSLDAKNLRTSVKIETQGNGLSFLFTVKGTASISAMDNLQQISPGPEAYGAISQAWKQQILQETSRALSRCIEKNADVFSLTRRLLLADPAYWKEHHTAFEENLNLAFYRVQVDVSLLGTGQERTPTH